MSNATQLAQTVKINLFKDINVKPQMNDAGGLKQKK